MPISHRRPAPHERAPRHALWCRAGVRALVADPAATATVVAGDALVPAHGPGLQAGRFTVRRESAWPGPDGEPDVVGELLLGRGAIGLYAVGWWSAAVVDGRPLLVMDVAGLTVWSRAHCIRTEEPARIAAVLGDA